MVSPSHQGAWQLRWATAPCHNVLRVLLANSFVCWASTMRHGWTKGGRSRRRECSRVGVWFSLKVGICWDHSFKCCWFLSWWITNGYRWWMLKPSSWMLHDGWLPEIMMQHLICSILIALSFGCWNPYFVISSWFQHCRIFWKLIDIQWQTNVEVFNPPLLDA